MYTCAMCTTSSIHYVCVWTDTHMQACTHVIVCSSSCKLTYSYFCSGIMSSPVYMSVCPVCPSEWVKLNVVHQNTFQIWQSSQYTASYTSDIAVTTHSMHRTCRWLLVRTRSMDTVLGLSVSKTNLVRLCLDSVQCTETSSSRTSHTIIII